jgi:uncharacterized RDD family membrane protein YckC
MTTEPTVPEPESQPANEAEGAPPPASTEAVAAAPPVPVAAAVPPVAAPVVASAPPPAAPPTPTWQAPPEPAGPFPGVKFADHGKRLVSYILDVIIVAVLTTVVAIGLGILVGVFAVAGMDWLAVLSGITLLIAVFLISLAYWPYFWIHGGVTPGMRAVGGIRVVMDKDGGPVTLGPAILRLIGYWIDTLIFYLGFIWILIDSRRRGWHDLIAGTVVIQEE